MQIIGWTEFAAKRSLLVAVPVLTLLPALPLLAQETQGSALTFGLSQRLEASDNPLYSVTDAQGSVTSTTNLSFSFTKATPISSLSFGGSGVLRAARGSGADDVSRGFSDPSLSFSYTRGVSSSTLSLGASLTTTDIATSSFTTVDPDTGLPIDVTDLSGTGRKQTHSLSAELGLAQDAPLSYTLSAGTSGVNYIDASDSSLYDTRRERLGAKAKLILNEVATASIGLSYSHFTDEDPTSETRVTTGVSADLAIARPNGTVTTGISNDNTPEGNRTSLTLGRSYDLPDGSISASFGVTHTEAGQNVPVGSLSYQRDLKNGKLSFGLRRSVISGETTDAESKVSAMTFGYQHVLSPLSSFSVSGSYSDTGESTASSGSKSSSLSISYAHSLTEDWALDMGYSYRVRKTDGSDAAKSNTVYMQLSRSFTVLR
jgi:hypothetical protein